MPTDVDDPSPRSQAFARVVDALAQRKLTFATAESLTGGLLASCVASTPGAGDVFLGGVVSYAREVKRNLLDVPPGPVVSAPAAEAMAIGAADLLGSDVAVSLTGVAGPDPQDGEPPGTVYVAVAIDGAVAVGKRLELIGDPDEVRAAATTAAAELVVAALDSVLDPR